MFRQYVSAYVGPIKYMLNGSWQSHIIWNWYLPKKIHKIDDDFPVIHPKNWKGRTGLLWLSRFHNTILHSANGIFHSGTSYSRNIWMLADCTVYGRVNVNVVLFFIYLLFSHRYFLYNGNVLYFFYPILIFAIIHWVHVLTVSGYVRPWLTSDCDACVLPAIRSSIVRYVWRVEVYVVGWGWVVCIYRESRVHNASVAPCVRLRKYLCRGCNPYTIPL